MSLLLDHNVPVYNEFEKMLFERKECILITATGTGKSYITTEFLIRHNLKSLVVSPRLAINKSWKDLAKDHVDTVTYQWFTKHFDEIDKEYDAYIFDEAHHIGGRKWEHALIEFRKTCNKLIIGLTADSKRYCDGGRDMATEFFHNNIIFGHDIKTAIESGILSKPTYVCSLFNTDGLYKKYSNKKITDRLRKRLDFTYDNCHSVNDILIKHMPTNNRKGIVFVDSISSIPYGINTIKKAFPNEKVLFVHSEIDKKVNESILEMFKKMKHGYIVAVDMLNEGIHISGVNTVIMFRRTSSPTVYMQQVGRCLSSNIDDVCTFDFVGNRVSLDVKFKKENDVEDKKYVLRQSINTGVDEFQSQSIVYDYATPFLDVLYAIDRYMSFEWTDDEIDILRRYYPEIGGRVSKILVNRSANGCRLMAMKLGLVKNGCTHTEWTDDEIDILRRYYPEMGGKCTEKLPGRSCDCIRSKAAVLGLKVDRSLAKKYRNPKESKMWTKEEDEILKKYYPTFGTDCCSLLNNKSEMQCRSRASRLGVHVVFWTDKEKELLKEHYPKIGLACHEYITDKSKSAIVQMARKLNLKSEMNNKMTWTKEEDNILIKNYPKIGIDGCMLLLDRRSRQSISARTRFLRLR